MKQKNKKWFTIIEVLITTLIVATLSLPVFEYLGNTKRNSINAKKELQVKTLWQELITKITNIRDSSWVESNSLATKDMTYCSDKMPINLKWTIIWNSYWWYCNPIDKTYNTPFADLLWEYKIVSWINITTDEKFNWLEEISWGHSWVVPINQYVKKNTKEVNYDDVRAAFSTNAEDNPWILSKYEPAFTNLSSPLINWFIFYSIKFEDPVESDFSNIVDISTFTNEEKEYYLNQSKKVRIRIDYTLAGGKRKTYSVSKLMTNYLAE